MAFTMRQVVMQLEGIKPFLVDDPQLLAIVSGFFVFPIQKGKFCGSLLGPIVPLAPHQSKLLIFDPRLEDMRGPSIPVSADEGIAVVDVTGKSVSVERCIPSPASTVNGNLSTANEVIRDLELDCRLIPDFGSLCCGVKLDTALATAQTLQTRLDLVGGYIGGIHDQHTCKETWAWKDCRGRRHNQRLSSLAVHISDPLPNLNLTITPLDQSAPPTIIPVSPIPELNLAIVALCHVPIDPSNDPDDLTVDIAHLNATMALCRRTGAVSVQFGQRRPKTCRVKTSSKRHSFGNLDALLEILSNFIILNNGRPNCSSRQMKA